MKKANRDLIALIATLLIIATLLVVWFVMQPLGQDQAVIPPPTQTPQVLTETTASPSPTPTLADAPLRHATIRAVGDIMMHQDQLDAHKGKKGYSFDTAFVLIKDSLSSADYTIGNLEGTIGKANNKGYTGFPAFNAPPALLDSLKDAGFDMLTLANNHILDRFYPGIEKTIANIEKVGFDHVGASRSAEEQAAPCIVDVNGIQIGMLAYTEHTNGMERYTDEEALKYCVNLLSKANFKKDVQALREAGADLVFAFPHWGTEYEQGIDSAQKKWTKKMVDAGVDVIIGSHPHVVQPIKYVKSSDGEHRALVAYSLGNFVGMMVDRYACAGIILELEIEETEPGKFQVINPGYVPFYMWPGAVINGGRVVRPMPIMPHWNKTPKGMKSDKVKAMKQAYRDIRNLLGTNPAAPLDE
ncbi:CapA family protein [Eubacteriales bacterium OttesenSCG-928-N13]|nr:CapA family protein [Eubacteriales bacterium OttesenSCG-928-N13]